MSHATADTAKPPSYKQRVKENAKEYFWGFVVWAVFLGFSMSAKWIYQSVESVVDDSGWVEHSHDTPVWIGGDWLTGEYRICQMSGPIYGKLPNAAHLLCGIESNIPDFAWPQDFVKALSPQEFDSIFYQQITDWTSADHYFHVLPVEYWGRIDRNKSNESAYSWRCQKQTSGLECKAIN
jgi:hypothetical protein